MKESTKQSFSFITSKILERFGSLRINPLFQRLQYTNSVILGIVVFGMIFVVKCNNDSDLDGIKYYEAGKYKKALSCYNEFLTLHPHHLATLYNRGRCYEALGDTEKAKHDYNEVIDRDSGHVNALLALSLIYYNEQDYQPAINLSRQATLVDKENYLAHYYLGRALHKIGDLSNALDCYNQAIDLNPDFGFAYFHRSSVMLSYGFLPFGCYDLQTAEQLNVEGAKEAKEKYCIMARPVAIK